MVDPHIYVKKYASKKKETLMTCWAKNSLWTLGSDKALKRETNWGRSQVDVEELSILQSPDMKIVSERIKRNLQFCPDVTILMGWRTKHNLIDVVYMTCGKWINQLDQLNLYGAEQVEKLAINRKPDIETS